MMHSEAKCFELTVTLLATEQNCKREVDRIKLENIEYFAYRGSNIARLAETLKEVEMRVAMALGASLQCINSERTKQKVYR